MKNWKTTLLGIAIGAIPMVESVLKAIQNGEAVNWVQFGIGVLIMAFGYVSKDFNVTGGTK